MSQLIDLTAARLVHQARVLERAVHDRGPWEIEIGGIREDAYHIICPSRVILIATFPGVCWVESPDTVNLYCRGEMVDSKRIDPPTDGVFRLEWNLVAEPSAVNA